MDDLNHFTGISLDGMVQYIKLEGADLLDNNTEENSIIRDLVLEDGTKAMIVNGTLVNEDGQALVLQDGTDLSQFYIDDNYTAEVSKDQELPHQMILDDCSQDTTIQYVEDSNSNAASVQSDDQQVFYIQDSALSLEEEPTQMLQLDNEEVPVSGIIDLENFFLSQQDLANLETGNYQYAILKDGKFHLQQAPAEVVSFNENVEIKGRNTVTGQVISLPKNGPFKKNRKPLDNVKTLESGTSLKRLINKKITIGQTSTGKKIVGKIVNIIKNKKQEKKHLNTEEICNFVQKPIRKYATPVKKNLVKNTIATPTTVLETTSQSNPQKPTQKMSSDNSKIIVHKKAVSKDYFDLITRTMSGLMNMDSVVKKLKNKTVIIKIIEKTFNTKSGNFSKTVSYCTGSMLNEFKFEEGNTYSEWWRFVPDVNSKEVIFGSNENIEETAPPPVLSNSKKIVNLTIQVTVSQYGKRTTKVFINPPALFQCKTCFTSFRTSTLLKIHSLNCHPPGKQCLEPKENLPKKGMFECLECNQCFTSSPQVQKHMDMHYSASSQTSEEEPVGEIARKVFTCHICGRQFSRHSNLQRHIEIHKGEGAMYQCAICNCSYHYISTLTRHIVSCHIDKTKKIIEKNVNTQQPVSLEDYQLKFLEEGQIQEIIPLEQITEDSLQQYVTQYIDQDDI